MASKAWAEDVLAIILGGEQGARLFPLTAERAKPAVPLGGKYRLIDIAVSNCINSGIQRIYIPTQFNTATLHRHITRTYQFSGFTNAFVDILSAEQTLQHSNWSQSMTDAVRRAWRHLDRWDAETYLILPGDHLYRMNYRHPIRHHWQTGADLTMAVTAVSRDKAMDSGVVRIDPEGRILTYHEQPREEVFDQIRLDQCGGDPVAGERNDQPFWVSMGIYVFRKSVLRRLLDQTTTAFDFGMELIPRAVQTCQVRSYSFEGYWEKMGDIESFYRANLDLVAPQPKFNLYDPRSPIFTHPRWLPPAKIRDCDIRNCLLGEGVILSGAQLRQCVVGVRTRIERDARLERTVIMGASRYQPIREMDEERRQHRPSIGIGQQAVIRDAIIDTDARIGAGARITNEAGVQRGKGKGYYIRGGIVVIPRGSIISEGTVI